MYDTAVRAGYPVALRMSPRQLFEVAKIEEIKRGQDFIGAASATRAAHTDKRGWKRLLAELE